MPTAILRSLHVTPDAAAISAVRAFVRECCVDWGVSESSDTAVLLASELATNAVRYASMPVTVWLGYRTDRIVLSVEDASHDSATVRAPSVTDEGGRGLLLVDALAERWGEREVPTGKLVWAEIATRQTPEMAPSDA